MDDNAFSTLSSLEDYPETARLLGNLTVAWSHAERILYFAFWVASGTTQSKAFDLYEGMSNFRSRYEMTIDLLKQDANGHPKMPEAINKIQTLLQCFQTRNEFVHRTWVKTPQGSMALLDHRMPQRGPSAKTFTDLDLKNLIIRINTTCGEFMKLVMEIFPNSFAPAN